ncbi:hypothetical protein ABT187_17410 [Streptomyces sp. NPDC001817]|uniref:hypothetical protein n=1 Tax=Streptomyces sp. NPDC001817 TaxID=3154398 RepID=UPI003327DFEE
MGGGAYDRTRRDGPGPPGTALSVNSQLGASVGTAVLSVVLGAAGMRPAGFRTACAVATTLPALAAVPALLLPGPRQAR